MLVRSTTANIVAPAFASTAIASPLAGVWYAVTVCGSKPFENALPILQVTQSVIAGFEFQTSLEVQSVTPSPPHRKISDQHGHKSPYLEFRLLLRDGRSQNDAVSL